MVVLGLALAAAVIAAIAWVQFAEPPRWTLRDGTLVMDQLSAGRQITVDVTFVVIGLIAGLVIGGVTQLVLASDWVGALAVAAAAAAGGILAWQLGVWLGPDDPRLAPGLSEGDNAADQLGINSYGPLFAWPIGSLVGVLIGSLFNRAPRGVTGSDSSDQSPELLDLE